jgi:hypothetical protein
MKSHFRYGRGLPLKRDLEAQEWAQVEAEQETSGVARGGPSRRSRASSENFLLLLWGTCLHREGSWLRAIKACTYETSHHFLNLLQKRSS